MSVSKSLPPLSIALYCERENRNLCLLCLGSVLPRPAGRGCCPCNLGQAVITRPGVYVFVCMRLLTGKYSHPLTFRLKEQSGSRYSILHVVLLQVHNRQKVFKKKSPGFSVTQLFNTCTHKTQNMFLNLSSYISVYIAAAFPSALLPLPAPQSCFGTKTFAPDTFCSHLLPLCLIFLASSS